MNASFPTTRRAITRPATKTLPASPPLGSASAPFSSPACSSCNAAARCVRGNPYAYGLIRPSSRYAFAFAIRTARCSSSDDDDDDDVDDDDDDAPPVPVADADEVSAVAAAAAAASAAVSLPPPPPLLLFLGVGVVIAPRTLLPALESVPVAPVHFRAGVTTQSLAATILLSLSLSLSSYPQQEMATAAAASSALADTAHTHRDCQ